MTIWFYVKTTDTPQTVGNVVCAYNVFEDAHPQGRYSWVLQQGKGPEEYWQIMGKYEQLRELTNIAIVYRTGDAVVVGEVGDDFVPSILDPLMQRYGFDNLKWVTAVPKMKTVSRRPIVPT